MKLVEHITPISMKGLEDDSDGLERKFKAKQCSWMWAAYVRWTLRPKPTCNKGLMDKEA